MVRVRRAGPGRTRTHLPDSASASNCEWCWVRPLLAPGSDGNRDHSPGTEHSITPGQLQDQTVGEGR